MKPESGKGALFPTYIFLRFEESKLNSICYDCFHIFMQKKRNNY